MASDIAGDTEFEVRFDHYAYDQAQDPFALYGELRAHCPVAHTASHGGFYLAASYDLVRRVLSDFRTFSSADGTGIPKMEQRLLPIDLDPPLHTGFRRVLNPHFTPEAVEAHRRALQDRVDTLIDGFIALGEADLLEDLVRPTLSHVVLPMLGIPVEELPRIAALVDYMIRRRSDDPQGVGEKSVELATNLAGRVEARRAGEPQDDLLQVLIDGRVAGAELTTDQIVSVLILVLFGGLDTTSSVAGFAIQHLSRHPEDIDALLAGDDSLWARAIEEFVRLACPVQGQRRTAAAATQLGGVPLDEGAYVFALMASANRDATHFPEPDRCLIARSPNEHLAFGSGGHVCMGRNLARLELRIFLETAFRRLRDLRVKDGYTPTYTIGEARGPQGLRCTFTPGEPTRPRAA